MKLKLSHPLFVVPSSGKEQQQGKQSPLPSNAEQLRKTHLPQTEQQQRQQQHQQRQAQSSSQPPSSVSTTMTSVQKKLQNLHYQSVPPQEVDSNNMANRFKKSAIGKSSRASSGQQYPYHHDAARTIVVKPVPVPDVVVGGTSSDAGCTISSPVPIKYGQQSNYSPNAQPQPATRRQVSSGSRTMSIHTRRRSRATGGGGLSGSIGRTFSTSESSLASATYAFSGATPSVCSVSTHGSSDVTSLASSILNSPRGYARGAGSQYPYPTQVQHRPLPPTIEIAVAPQPQQLPVQQQNQHRTTRESPRLAPQPPTSSSVAAQHQQQPHYCQQKQQPPQNDQKRNDRDVNGDEDVVSDVSLPPTRFMQTYELSHSIGCNKGAFSTVWKGIHKSSGIPVAVKMIKRDALTAKEDKAVFNEVALLQKLQEEHPRTRRMYEEQQQQQRKNLNVPQDASFHEDPQDQDLVDEEGGIIEVYDFFVTEHTFYIVTEYMDGGDLMDLLAQCGRFLEEEICSVIYSLVKSIHYMHNTCGVAHRDLKPENLLLGSRKYYKNSKSSSTKKTSQLKNNTSQGRHVFGENMETIKIADFGLASHVTHPRSLLERCGTPMYVAPEVLRGTPYDQTCDMWSLGVIVYYLLSGCPPFYDRKSKQALYKKILKGHVVLDGDGWDTISPEAKHFIASCLIVNPRGRMKSSEAIHHPWFASLVSS